MVYGDLRDVIFERLYRFHVQVARLELVLQVRVVLQVGGGVVQVRAGGVQVQRRGASAEC